MLCEEGLMDPFKVWFVDYVCTVPLLSVILGRGCGDDMCFIYHLCITSFNTILEDMSPAHSSMLNGTKSGVKKISFRDDNYCNYDEKCFNLTWITDELKVYVARDVPKTQWGIDL